MRIGLMLPNWIGDVVMATPALRALRRGAGPDAQLIGIVRPYVAEVLHGTHWLNDTLTYEPRRSPLALWPLARRLHALKLDQLLLFTNSFRAALVGRLARVPTRIGFVRYGRGWLLTHKLYPRRRRGRCLPVSPVDDYLELVGKAGFPPQGRQLELATLPEDQRLADRVWDELALASARRVIAVNTGGAYGQAKQWPASYFAQLARRMASDLEAAVVVLCGPAERSRATEIEREANHPAVRSLAHLPPRIGLTKACLRRSQLLVTTDSGPRHLAAALGIPVVTLFGPTDPRWSENYHADERRLQRTLPCSPCGQRICPLDHHRCMHELTPELVFSAVRQHLERTSRSRAA